jgi:hypothetical protein
MAVKWLRCFVLMATVVAFVSHMPAEAGDSCHTRAGVLRCADRCNETLDAAAPILNTPYKLAVSSKICHPDWSVMKRVLPGLMVSVFSIFC